MHAYARDPEGIGQSLRPVVNDDLTWQVQLQPMKVGIHHVWVAAEDEAGNLTTAGPFNVDVAGILENSMNLLGPVVTPTPTAIITTTLPLTPTMTITSTGTITPTLTPIPQPTETPTPVPLPTVTPTPTITTTFEIPSTAAILPILSPASIWIEVLTPNLTGRWSWFR